MCSYFIQHATCMHNQFSLLISFTTNALPFYLVEVKFLVNFVISSVCVQKKVKKNGLLPSPRTEYRGK